MNWGPDRSWPVVTAETFQRMLDTFDYYRDGWSDCILYRWKRKSRLFGFELNDGTYHLHPELKEE